jgi:ring-1,2-phenylacetyl-CoA epoxidase subunit PaaC
MTSHLDYVLRLADTNLIWSHRLGEWCGHGPVLEEDIALANIGLDTLGQARMLYDRARALDPAQRSEDAFGYFRDAEAFHNFAITALPNGDYAHTIVRNLILSVYFKTLWTALATSSDIGLREIAAKAMKESSYHVRHAADWVTRFGDSTAEARQRVEAALLALWPYVSELFDDDAVNTENCAAGIAVDVGLHHANWSHEIESILADATLSAPSTNELRNNDQPAAQTENLTRLLAEMQSLARAHPGATW